jgi:formylmethanofuran dehydrogenase subunit B
MRGFNETLFEAVGAVNKFSFSEKKSDKAFEFSELLRRNAIDAALIIGTDPVSSLPYDVSRNLMAVKKITIDPKNTLTASISEVSIRSALSGIESGGEMVRSDGVRQKLRPIEKTEYDDVYILKKILEGL